VFLFDEPLSNLDAKLRVQMRLEIRKLQSDLGVTSIYVTHDQIEAMTLGHRLLVLNEGIVEQVGTPIELYESPATLFVAAFIGSPSMNLLDVTLPASGNDIELPGGERLPLPDGTASSLRGRLLTLGIRPEHLEVAEEARGVAHLRVDVVEQLGADTLVHGHFGTNRINLTVRLPGVKHYKAGDVLPLSVEARHLHLFDADTGQRV
jgi:sn-glycerol 3-phosphate transport system ATP-binding protein